MIRRRRPGGHDDRGGVGVCVFVVGVGGGVPTDGVCCLQDLGRAVGRGVSRPD